MEASSGSDFGIDTILSNNNTSSTSPVLMNGDFRLGDCRTAEFRTQATPSPCSEIDTVGTAPSSPISVTMEHPEQHLIQDSIQHHRHHQSQQQSLQLSPQPAQQIGAAGSAPRTATSSFLIKDILGDSKPLAACAPYSTSVSSPHHSPKADGTTATESFRPKLEQGESKCRLDKRDDIQSDMKCNGNLPISVEDTQQENKLLIALGVSAFSMTCKN
ncbi:UNVERIFIED_CONTAM: hypothetical protein FKN15_038256 [Acipenser sinensis]